MISENLKKIEEKIAETCAKCGRNRSEISLIAVSKTQPGDIIFEALKAGLKNLGENKAQELRDKSELIWGDFRWHFIGHLQTNKVKYVIKAADFIHSLDSINLADEVNRKAEQIGKIQNVLLEIKTSDEATKFGLQSEEEIFEIAEFCKKCSNLNLIGLMTMATYTEDKSIVRNCFIKLREIKERINKHGFGLTDLSMGMTNDYDVAIEEGATMLRIGTAIFGEKNY